MALRAAINGFGRIGRLILRASLEQDAVEIVGINDPNPVEQLAYLMKYDTTHRRFKGEVRYKKDALIINEREIQYSMERDPLKLPWKKLDVDLVFEATGIFESKEKASPHLQAGAKRVMITAPGKGVDGTFVYGVNHTTFNPQKHIIFSNASCTTNCLAPVAKILHENFGIKHGLMTTVHAYTNDQRTLDLPHPSDYRRGRTAAMNLIPTSTGAASAIGLVIPALAGKLDGMALRAPLVDGSIIDLVCELEKKVTTEEINTALKKAAEQELKGIMEYTEDPIVSSDIIGYHLSSVVDGLSTKVVDENLIKVLAWYDNEWGYTKRLIDLAGYIKKLVQ